MQIMSENMFEEPLQSDLPFLLKARGQCFFCKKTTRELKIFLSKGGGWVLSHCIDIDPNENVGIQYVEPHGVEKLYFLRSAQSTSSLPYAMSFWRKDGEEQRISLESKKFLGMLGESRYLYTTLQNGSNSGHIFCSTTSRETVLWQTTELYTFNDNVDVIFSWQDAVDEIYVFDYNNWLVDIYSFDGKKVARFSLPTNIIHEGQYKPIITKQSGSYYLEGFWGKIDCYGKCQLGCDMSDSSFEPYFSLMIPDDAILFCEKHNNSFLVAQIAEENKRNGDLVWHISKCGNEYVPTKVLFAPQPGSKVGGANVEWVDDKHFVYWNPGKKTTFCYVDTSGKIDGKISDIPDVLDVVVSGENLFVLCGTAVGAKMKFILYSICLR